MLLSVEPPTYGRHDFGDNSTIATHHPADANIAGPATSNCQSRLRSRGGAAIRYVTAKPGTTTISGGPLPTT